MTLRPPRGVCDAHLLRAYKPCVIEALTTKTSWKVWRPPPYLPIGFSWDCCNDTRFVSLVDTSFTDPHGGLNLTWKIEVAQKAIPFCILLK